MDESAIKKIEELLDDPEMFSPENMEKMIQEIAGFFSQLKMAMESPDEKKRAEALLLVSDMRKRLESQVLNLCKTMGVDPEQLKTYVNNQALFSPEEWQAMENAKAVIESYKETYVNSSSESSQSKQKTRVKPKTVKSWLVG